MKLLSEIQDWRECVNEVVQGDCLEGMKKLPDKSIDLILTDPPYGLDKKLFQGGSRNQGWAMSQYKGNVWDKIPTDEIFEEIFKGNRRRSRTLPEVHR